MPDSSAGPRPLISVIMPVLNEASHIEKAIGSLLQQEAQEFDFEILALDGKSTDGTIQKLASLAAAEPRIRVLTNEKRTAPAAFNLGLRAAKGEYVCIMGAHADYERNYLAVCYRELLARGAIGCSGHAVTCPADPSAQARLVTWVLGHPFGTSASSSRTQAEGYVDSIAFPLFVKQALLDAGGYRENLTRNQDNDMNERLRARGHKLYLTWKTSALYYPKKTIRELLQYGFRNGYWNVISLKVHPASMKTRHFVPFVFVLALLVSLGLAFASAFLDAPRGLLWGPLLVLLGLHFGLGAVAAAQTALRQKQWLALALPPLFLAFHTAYGLGSLWGFLSSGQQGRAEAAWQRADCV